MATPGQLQMYNKVEISEMFGLDHRAKNPLTGKIERIHIKPDEKVPDAVVYDIWLEDHTLGNSLRMELLRNELVLFAGYKVPHPLNNMIELRVQTLPKTTPEIAVRTAIRNLKAECKSMLEQFDEGVAACQAAAAAKEPIRIVDRREELEPPSELGDRLDEGIRDFERLGATSSEYDPEFSPGARSPDAPADAGSPDGPRGGVRDIEDMA